MIEQLSHDCFLFFFAVVDMLKHFLLQFNCALPSNYLARESMQELTSEGFRSIVVHPPN